MALHRRMPVYKPCEDLKSIVAHGVWFTLVGTVMVGGAAFGGVYTTT